MIAQNVLMKAVSVLGEHGRLCTWKPALRLWQRTTSISSLGPKIQHGSSRSYSNHDDSNGSSNPNNDIRDGKKHALWWNLRIELLTCQRCGRAAPT